MPLEQEGERVQVYTGLAMRMRLIRILGPARAWRVAQLVARFGGPVLGVDWERRTFLRRAVGALAGWIILREEGTPSSAATALSLLKSSLSIPEEIEILTGILRERWENGIIIETHDQTWRITLDPSTSIWKGGERDAEVLQIGDEVMVRGWRSRGDFSFRALRIWVNLTRIRGVLLEATSSGWRIQGGQHHGEEEKYEVVWHASPTLLDLATCTPLSGNGIRIREGRH